MQTYEPWEGHSAGLPAPPSYPGLPEVPQGWGTSGRPPRHKRAVVAGVIALLLALAAIGTWGSGPAPTHQDVRALGRIRAGAAASAIPAIVDINTFRTVFAPDGTGPIRQVPLGAGTGMVLTPTGEVLTNNHVVDGAASIRVSVAGHPTPFNADVIGVDTSNDVALIQLQQASGLPTVTLGDPSSIPVGAPVIAVGNALGKGGPPAVTTGTVTGLHRSITATGGFSSEDLSNMIRTDAPIQPGDSGGALVDAHGEVVGMITAASKTAQNSASVSGYAIPIGDATGIVTQIRAGQETGTILLGERGFLGVEVNPKPVDRTTAARLGLPDTSGALVVGVQPDSPAKAAGIGPSAVIRAIDGNTIDSTAELGTLLHSHVPGERVSVTWVDSTGQHTATVSLIDGPAV